MTGMTGSLCHMAPEVFNAPDDFSIGYDETADIFSAAVQLNLTSSTSPNFTLPKKVRRPETCCLS